MGYTHYWTIDFSKTTEQRYKTACNQIARLAKRYQRANPKGSTGRLSGFTAHAAIGRYDGISINGSGQLAHEDFVLPGLDNIPLIEKNFCKTAQKPYDSVVVGALILLKHYLGDAVTVNSDGDRCDWLTGWLLAKQLVPSVEIPDTIRATERPKLRIV